MSILNDKVYEGMDWLSQAVEPYQSRLNDVIALLPQEHILCYNEVVAMLLSHSYLANISTETVIYQLLKTKEQYTKSSYTERLILTKYFKVIADECSYVNGETSELTGTIKLIKVANILEDQDVKLLMKEHSYLRLKAMECNTQAIMDLGSLLFTDPKHAFYAAKSPKARLTQIKDYLLKSVDEDYFRIRSDVAYENFMALIGHYLSQGHPTNLGKIYRYIMMARSGRTIYEAEYEKA